MTTSITHIDAENFNQTIDGKQVQLFTLENTNGVISQITNYGGRIVSLWTPDRNGNFEDVVLGYDHLNGYLNTPANLYLGAIIGRFGNRIKKGKLELNSKEYQLAINNGPNHLHGGLKGFDSVVWNAKQTNKQTLELSYLSIDGEENYPGNLLVTVIYTLTNENELSIEYKATTDASTPINLTNHSYFNLKGAGNGSIENHLLKIDANHYIPTDEYSIPLGILKSVEDTPMDFRVSKKIGQDLHTNDEQLLLAKGYDHTFVFNNNSEKKPVAIATEPISGRTLEVYTNEPGAQFYTGNYVSGSGTGKYNKEYISQESFCLETQHYPNSPNQSNFPSTILNPNEEYYSICIYKFGIVDAK